MEKILRTVLVYGGLAVLLRVAGKRDLAQLNSFDLVVVLLLANVVQNAIIGNDNSLAGGLLGAATLVVLNGLVVRLVNRSSRLVRVFEGNPTTLVRHGEIVSKGLRRMGLRRADLVAACRRQGADDLSEIADATLAPGGALVVTLNQDHHDATVGDLRREHDRLLAEIRAELAEIKQRLRPDGTSRLPGD